MKRYNGHTKYTLKDGTLVPGVTTILKLLSKEALVGWANRLGLENIEVRRYVDELADIGSLAHYFVDCDVKGKPRDPETLKDYTENHRVGAEICFNKFLEWKKETGFEPIKSEINLVSEKYRFGGTVDLYGLRHNKKTLVDFKTGNSIYPEAFTQVSAYKVLLLENGYEVEDQRIIRIGRSENEGFEDRYSPSPMLHFERFKKLLDVYNINKELGL